MNTVGMGVAIVGCGLIGRKRAGALGVARLTVCADAVFEKAQGLASEHPGAVAVTSWEAAVAHRDVDIVIVATANNMLAEISRAAVEAGKHVLVEKPAARNAGELSPLADAARRTGRLVRVGFNHRYHPAMLKAREIFLSGALGELMFVRGRYGHGGRLGYEKEWRADPIIAGGGELIDQGVHLIDLAHWFLGDLRKVCGVTRTFFWSMAVEDNAFLTLEAEKGQIAFLHVSCTEWKNLFSLEIYGRDAKLMIDGLGGSYGTERLAHYRMLPGMGPPETTIWEYPGPDTSWRTEFAEFLEDIRLQRPPSAGLPEAMAVLKLTGEIYR
jgi:predicted dehydrogenase